MSTHYGVGTATGVFGSPVSVSSTGSVAGGEGVDCGVEDWPAEVISIGVGGRVAFGGIVGWLSGQPRRMSGIRSTQPQSIETPDCRSTRKLAAPPQEIMLKTMPARITHVKKRRSRSLRMTSDVRGRLLLGDVLFAGIDYQEVDCKHSMPKYTRKFVEQ